MGPCVSRRLGHDRARPRRAATHRPHAVRATDANTRGRVAQLCARELRAGAIPYGDGHARHACPDYGNLRTAVTGAAARRDKRLDSAWLPMTPQSVSAMLVMTGVHEAFKCTR